jgi:hypothetical protein
MNMTQETAVTLEWARVAPNCIVVATRTGAWVHHPDPDGLPDTFDEPMVGPGGLDTTTWLLDGAIGAAAFGRSSHRAAPALTPLRWLWRLAGYYRTTEATSRLLPLAARRFGAAKRKELEAWALRGTREERGHDELALRDIRALGYDAEQVVARLVPSAVRAMVDYFTDAVVEADDPIGCVGYSYALERLAAERNSDEVAAVQAILPPGINATRCMRVHSASGADVKHVADTIEVVARLSAPERVAIARACYETARFFYAPRPAGPRTDEEIANLLAADGTAAAERARNATRPGRATSEEAQWQRARRPKRPSESRPGVSRPM